MTGGVDELYPLKFGHCFSLASFTMNRALLALLLAVATLVPAGQCGAPAQRPSSSTSGAVSTCSLTCDPVDAGWTLDSSLAPAGGRHAAEGFPSQTRGAGPEVCK